jgi:hypothetical protein
MDFQNVGKWNIFDAVRCYTPEFELSVRVCTVIGNHFEIVLLFVYSEPITALA